MAGKPWTTEEENLLKEYCGKHISFKKMVNYIPTRTASSLQSHARIMKLSNPICNYIYDYDRDFFKIPNYLNSFFCGWIAADGYVRKRDDVYHDFAWEMKSEDEEFLFLLKEKIKYNGPIEKFFKTGELYRLKSGEYHSRIRLNSLKQAATHLKENFGIEPQKTYRLGPPPNLNNIELKLAYICGFINGDGCISFNENRKQFGIKFYSSGSGILQWCQEVIESLNLPSARKKKGNIISNHPHSSTCKIFGFYGVQAIYFYEIVKALPIPVLKRKWDNPKYNIFIEKIKKEKPEWFIESIDSVMARNNIDFSKTF